MKSKIFKKILAGVLVMMMIVSMTMIAVSASGMTGYQSQTHIVFKHTEQTLAPGVTQYTNYAYTTGDNKQMVYYVTKSDLTRDDIVAQVAYKDMQCDEYGMDKLSNMVACANAKYSDPSNPDFISENYTVVSATNGDGYNMTTGEPGGCFVMNYQVKKGFQGTFLAIMYDGSARMGFTQADWDSFMAENNGKGIKEAIDIFGSMLVKDGVNVAGSATGSYYADRHSRTMIGITADGELVNVVVDGRQEPFSCGASMVELAEIMLEAGCEYAFNLDGGGSTTYMMKSEGSDTCVVANRPSDGSERSISNGFIIASTAARSDIFDHVSMTVNDEYITPGTSTTFTVSGVSPSGTSAEIPADVTYVATNGTVTDGVFTSDGTVGDAVITAMYNGEAVGTAKVHVVIPDAIKFASATITVPYGKTATIEIEATYGLNEVVTKPADFSFTLENTAAGTIDGVELTACDEDSNITSSNITVTFVGTELTDTATLAFGKGSEVIFDFEDGTTQGFNLGYSGYNYYLPNSSVKSVDETTGKVHSGEHALQLNIDYSNSWESGYMMTALYRATPAGEEGNKVFPSAKSIGAWLYIPKECESLWVRWVLYTVTSFDEDGNPVYGATITSNAMDNTAGGTGVVHSFSESGWHYLSCDFSNYAGAAFRDYYYCMQFYVSDRDGASYGYYANNYANIPGAYTFYLDDITVDYSSVIDDREAPVFSNVTYAVSGMSDAAALAEGATLNANTVDFAAAVADNMSKTNATGIDASTAKAYVDGNEVACTYTNGTISIDNSTELTQGLHKIKFSICDKQGNYSSVIRTVNVATGNKAGVSVVAHDDTLDRIKFGSVYYIDVKADAAETIDTVTTSINLDAANKWELDHMDVAKGFTADYTYDPDDRVVNLTITKNDDCTLTGEQALVSIPVRVWELDNVGSRIGGSSNTVQPGQYTYATFKAGNEYWWMAVEACIDQGMVTYTDGTSETFTGENVFCDTEAWATQKFMVETQEGKDYKAAWDGGHYHTAEAVSDMAPTCTEAGYSGRTFCAECNSVVDWGTTIPATGHSYTAVDGKLVCEDCGSVYESNETGLFISGDKIYYLIAGELKTGWFDVLDEDDSDNNYYFDPDTYEAVDGVKVIDGHEYTFTDKVLTKGSFYQHANGVRYYWAGKYVSSKWIIEDGSKYYFGSNSFMLTGFASVRNSTTSVIPYLFTNDGKLIEEDGLYKNAEDGNIYYLSQGECLYQGLVQDGDDYYYINSSKKAVMNSTYTVTKTNGYMPVGSYAFGADGKLIVEQPEETVKNGLYTDDDGAIRYYVDGVATYAGAVKDDNGNIYYINSSKQAVKNAKYTITSTKANGVVAPGTYTFDADGKLVVEQPETVKNGLYTDTDGAIRYYVDGVATYAGLVKVGDDYYYINSAKKALVSTKYTVTKTNGLIAAGTYEFGADGKMIIQQAETVKNGIVFEADGSIRYYVDGVATYAGAVQHTDGSIYYINSSKQAIKGVKYTITAAKSNGIIAPGTYMFDADGKLITD